MLPASPSSSPRLPGPLSFRCAICLNLLGHGARDHSAALGPGRVAGLSPPPLALRSCPFHAPPASVSPHPCPFLPFAPLLALGPLASVSASSLAPGRAGERAYGRRGLSQSQGVTWPSSGPWLSTPAVPYRPCDPWLSGFAAPSIHCTPSRPLGLGPGGEARGLRHGQYFVQR